MIIVKKINGQQIMVNSDLIETIEFSPHAIMSLTSGVKIIVDETSETLMEKIIEYKKTVRDRAIEFRVVPKTGTED
jgi:flagellar protein FlbD